MAQSGRRRRRNHHHQSVRADVGLPGRHVDHGGLFSHHGDFGGLRISIYRQRCFHTLDAHIVLLVLHRHRRVRGTQHHRHSRKRRGSVGHGLRFFRRQSRRDRQRRVTTMDSRPMARGAQPAWEPAIKFRLYDLLVGFASAWLAFSGLESISQLSPTMRLPLRRTTRCAMVAVIITMVVTAPILTALSIGLLPAEHQGGRKRAVHFRAGHAVGGIGDKARRGAHGIELAFVCFQHGDHRLLPCLSGARERRLLAENPAPCATSTFNTPHIAVGIATSIPMLVILSSAR